MVTSQSHCKSESRLRESECVFFEPQTQSPTLNGTNKNPPSNWFSVGRRQTVLTQGCCKLNPTWPVCAELSKKQENLRRAVCLSLLGSHRRRAKREALVEFRSIMPRHCKREKGILHNQEICSNAQKESDYRAVRWSKACLFFKLGVKAPIGKKVFLYTPLVYHRLFNNRSFWTAFLSICLIIVVRLCLCCGRFAGRW